MIYTTSSLCAYRKYKTLRIVKLLPLTVHIENTNANTNTNTNTDTLMTAKLPPFPVHLENRRMRVKLPPLLASACFS